MAEGRGGAAIPSGLVSFLFTDVEGSTKLWAADRKAMSASLAVHDHLMRDVLESHGGYIFTLADSAFAFACNSYNQNAVAQHNDITFCAPGRKGDRLTARAVEVVRNGRSGVYDVTVTNQDGTVIAVMRGNSRTIQGQNFQEEEPDG